MNILTQHVTIVVTVTRIIDTRHVFNFASSVLGFSCFVRLFVMLVVFYLLSFGPCSPSLAQFPWGRFCHTEGGWRLVTWSNGFWSQFVPWFWSVYLGLRYTGYCVIVIWASTTHSTAVILKMSRGPWEVSPGTFMCKPSLGISFKLNKSNGKCCPWILKLGWEQRVEGRSKKLLKEVAVSLGHFGVR